MRVRTLHSSGPPPARLAAGLRARVAIIATSFLIAGSVAALASSTHTPIYEAQSTLSDGSDPDVLGANPNRLDAARTRSRQLQLVATNATVLDAVINRLDLDVTASRLARDVNARTSSDGTIIEVAVADSDPARSAAISNMIAFELVELSTSLVEGAAGLPQTVDQLVATRVEELRRVEGAIKRLRDVEATTRYQRRRLRRLESSRQVLTTTYAGLVPLSEDEHGSGPLAIVENARVPSDPTSPQPLLEGLLGGILGVLVAVPLVVSSRFLDDRVRDVEDAEELTGLPRLGSNRLVSSHRTNDDHEPKVAGDRMIAAADDFRWIRSSIEAGTGMAPIGWLALVAPRHQDGDACAFAAVELAIGYAQSGKRVLLVDADPQRLRIETLVGAQGEGAHGGLADRRNTSRPGTIQAMARSTPQAGLDVLTATDAGLDITIRTRPDRIRGILSELAYGRDLVVIACPPVHGSHGALDIAYRTDATVLIIDAGRTRRRHLKEAARTLRMANVRAIGLVVLERGTSVPLGARDPHVAR